MSVQTMVVFDAPARLSRCFLDAGFLPFGRQAGAWHKKLVDPTSAEGRDLEYELKGAGLAVQWWAPPA